MSEPKASLRRSRDCGPGRFSVVNAEGCLSRRRVALNPKVKMPRVEVVAVRVKVSRLRSAVLLTERSLPSPRDFVCR